MIPGITLGVIIFNDVIKYCKTNSIKPTDALRMKIQDLLDPKDIRSSQTLNKVAADFWLGKKLSSLVAVMSAKQDHEALVRQFLEFIPEQKSVAPDLVISSEQKVVANVNPDVENGQAFDRQAIQKHYDYLRFQISKAKRSDELNKILVECQKENPPTHPICVIAGADNLEHFQSDLRYYVILFIKAGVTLENIEKSYKEFIVQIYSIEKWEAFRIFLIQIFKQAQEKLAQQDQPKEGKVEVSHQSPEVEQKANISELQNYRDVAMAVNIFRAIIQHCKINKIDPKNILLKRLDEIIASSEQARLCLLNDKLAKKWFPQNLLALISIVYSDSNYQELVEQFFDPALEQKAIQVASNGSQQHDMTQIEVLNYFEIEERYKAIRKKILGCRNAHVLDQIIQECKTEKPATHPICVIAGTSVLEIYHDQLEFYAKKLMKAGIALENLSFNNTPIAAFVSNIFSIPKWVAFRTYWDRVVSEVIADQKREQEQAKQPQQESKSEPKKGLDQKLEAAGKSIPLPAGFQLNPSCKAPSDKNWLVEDQLHWLQTQIIKNFKQCPEVVAKTDYYYYEGDQEFRLSALHVLGTSKVFAQENHAEYKTYVECLNVLKEHGATYPGVDTRLQSGKPKRSTIDMYNSAGKKSFVMLANPDALEDPVLGWDDSEDYTVRRRSNSTDSIGSMSDRLARFGLVTEMGRTSPDSQDLDGNVMWASDDLAVARTRPRSCT